MDAQRSLNSLLEAVRNAQETALRSADRRKGRERLAAHAQRRGRPRVRSIAAGIAFAATLAAIYLLTLRPPPALDFEVDGAPGHLATWMAAPTEGPKVLRFTDGTQLELRDEGRARIEELDSRGARVVLELGAIDANVMHGSQTRWVVQAGPFDIRVTGTRFSASWDPVESRFVVALTEGSVVVTGPSWEGERVVHAGETINLRLSGATPRPPAAAVDAFGATVAAPTPTTAAPARGADRPAPIDRIRALAAEGKYQDAYQLAESVGLAQLADGANAATMSHLADVCRLSGHASDARNMLERLRSRFPSSMQSTEAAFVLGRMAFDSGKMSEANRWFAMYLAERPGGPLAVEARGRMLECVIRTGDADAIRSSAEAYLALHPTGPHAAIARRALEAPVGSDGLPTDNGLPTER